MDNKLIGEQITRYRKERNLTQEELGRAVGVSTQAVSRWENGGAPDVALLPAIADKLGVTIDALFGREGGEKVNIHDVVARWLASVPQKDRFDQLCRLNWTALKNLVAGKGKFPEIGYMEKCEAKDDDTGERHLMTCQVWLEGGFMLDVHAEDMSFASVWPEPEAGYDAYFAPREDYRRLFAMLARPGCLELLEYLSSQSYRLYVPGTIAKALDMPVREAEELMKELTKLSVLHERELQLEDGLTSAYVMLPGVTLVALLYMARCMMQYGQNLVNVGGDGMPPLLRGEEWKEKRRTSMKRNERTPAAREYFRTFYEGNHIRFAAAMLLSILSVCINLLVSWLLGAVMDVIGTGDLERLVNLLWVVAGFAAANLLLDTGSNWAKFSFIRRALLQYKSLAFRKLSEKSISAFSQENTGRYLSTLTNDVSTIERSYLEKSFEIAGYSLLGVGALGMMIWYSPLLSAAAIALGLLPVMVVAVTGGVLARLEKAVSDQNEGFMAQVKDLLSGFAVIKSFKAEKEAGKLFGASSQNIEDAKYRRRWCEAVIEEASGLCGLLMQFGIFFIGAYLAIRGDITVGTVIVFLNLAGYLIGVIKGVPMLWANRRAAAALVEKLAQVTEENAGRSGDAIPARLDSAITLDRVTFGYKPDEPVLQDLSMKLEAGKKYALVGVSGSGKSTLLNLLMGAYAGYDGSIAIDGKELREVDPDSLYDVMSLIGQNVFLFDDTLYQNITMFRDFPEDKLELAVHRSGLDELVERKGESYRCGENGSGLSGGERQRVSIARCLMRETPVLLLDEATAALDNRTAFAVTDAILHLDGLTRVVVTHRLEEALLEQYDGIFVLRGGKVCEEGRFADLMARKEYFYSLYTVANG